jgi:hypothetical protein
MAEKAAAWNSLDATPFWGVVVIELPRAFAELDADRNSCHKMLGVAPGLQPCLCRVS